MSFLILKNKILFRHTDRTLSSTLQSQRLNLNSLSLIPSDSAPRSQILTMNCVHIWIVIFMSNGVAEHGLHISTPTHTRTARYTNFDTLTSECADVSHTWLHEWWKLLLLIYNLNHQNRFGFPRHSHTRMSGHAVSCLVPWQKLPKQKPMLSRNVACVITRTMPLYLGPNSAPDVSTQQPSKHISKSNCR